jgi:hypothetical protein
MELTSCVSAQARPFRARVSASISAGRDNWGSALLVDVLGDDRQQRCPSGSRSHRGPVCQGVAQRVRRSRGDRLGGNPCLHSVQRSGPRDRGSHGGPGHQGRAGGHRRQVPGGGRRQSLSIRWRRLRQRTHRVAWSFSTICGGATWQHRTHAVWRSWFPAPSWFAYSAALRDRFSSRTRWAGSAKSRKESIRADEA